MAGKIGTSLFFAAAVLAACSQSVHTWEEQRDAFVRDAKVRIYDMDGEIDGLQAMVAADGSGEVRAGLQDAARKVRAARKKVRVLEEAGPQGWVDLRGELDAALDDVDVHLDRVREALVTPETHGSRGPGVVR